MPINVSIFAHIHLDSELQGRFGVQGNLFKNTFAYLNYYMELAKKGFNPSLPSYYLPEISAKNLQQLKAISLSINQLVIEEDKQIKLNLRGAQPYSLKNYVDILANNLITLQNGEDFLLPGGWLNLDTPGHAMIYQFTKSPSGNLLFSIYNAGAGLSKHEKISSTANERYLPVKTYELRSPINPQELRIFLQRLTLANLSHHPERKEEDFDEDKLYQNIEKSLPFLNAKIVSNLIDISKTTAGQLTGTCSQRSIHQMLKLNFDTLSNYQRFIFGFKMHSLQDFINTHPIPRHQEITHLIQLAIENNLKLLQEPDLFASPLERDAAAQELIALKENLLKPIPAKLPQENKSKPNPKHKYFVTPATITTINSSSVHIASIRHEKRLLINVYPLSPIPLLKQISNILAECERLKNTDPLWVLDQIDHLILQLPLPTQNITHSTKVSLNSYYEDLPFYQQILESKDFNNMQESLRNLQKVYAYSSKKLLNTNKTPQMVVSHCSLLALQDYFDVTRLKNERLHTNNPKPSFHNYMASMLGLYLDSYRLSPHMATNQADFDKRLLELRKLYPCQPFLSHFIEQYFKSLYITILDSEPSLKEALENEYSDTYANNDSEEHRAIKKAGLGALCVLFQQIEQKREDVIIKSTSLLKQKRFAPLIVKIQQQFQQEQFFISNLYSLSHDPVNIMLEPEVSFNKEKNTLEVKTIKYLQDAQNVYLPTYENPISIAHNKYLLTDSLPRKALLSDYSQSSSWWQAPKKASSNQIQLSSYGTQKDSIITKEDYFNRELFHLRTSPTNQVNLTLDYFTSSIQKLKNPDVQVYMEANFFEPGLLRQTLDNDLTFLSRFDAFIDKGLHFFKDSAGLTSQESLFFIRLRYCVNHYVAQYNPELMKKRLEDNQLHLNALITAQSDKQVLADLHQYRFLTAISRYQRNEVPENISSFAETFYSYCFIQAQKNLSCKKDLTVQLELQRAERVYKDWLQTIPTTQLNDLIKPAVAQLGIDLAQFTQSNNYPVFTLHHSKTNITLIINVEQGRVYKDNKSYSSIPLDIQTHPIMRALGISVDAPCFLSADGNTMDFLNEGGAIRIKKTALGLVVQKEWLINGRKEWYELQGLADAQKSLLTLANATCINNLPANLKDGRSLSWINKGKSIFIAQDNQPKYVIPYNEMPEQLDEKGFQNDLQLQGDSPWQTTLSTFEDPDFYCVNYNAQSHKGTIDFARFGLSLIIEDDALCLPKTNYQVANLKNRLFKEGVSCLTLADKEGREQCIVAATPFYIDPNSIHSTGDFYKLTQDKSEYIAKECLKKKWQDRGLAEKDWPQWHHKDSVDTITYQVINGLPQAENAADALYLCYLYLATHEHEKAWDILNHISQRFTLEGNLKELTYLSWIINALPVVLDTKDVEKKLGTPQTTACQLKALALLTDLLAHDKKPLIPDYNSVDQSTTNGEYKAISLKETQAFYDALPHYIYQHYSKLQRVRRHLNEKYTLTDTECKSLLNYYHQKTPGDKPKALGALGYEWRRLSLKSLYKEYERLMALEKSGHMLSRALQKRLLEIKTGLDKHEPIMKMNTILELRDLDLSLYDQNKLNEHLLSPTAKNAYWDWQYNVLKIKHTDTVDEALAALNSAVSEETFIKNFPLYLQIAQEKDSANTRKLLEFCTSYLIGHRHVPLDKQNSNIPFLVNVLYRSHCNPHVLRSYASISLNFLSMTLAKLPVIPIAIYQAKDVFEQELSTNQNIWEALVNEIPVSIPIHTAALTLNEALSMQGVVNQCLATAGDIGNTLSTFYKAYQQAEEDFQSQLNLLQSEDDEQEAGQLQYQCLHKQQELARTTFTSPAIRGALHQNAAQAQKNIGNELAPKWNFLLQQVNNSLQQHFAIPIAAAQKRLLTQKDLLTLYLHADLQAYLEMTALNKEQCQELHAQIHECVTLEVERKHISRLLQALDNVQEPPKPTHLDAIASVFMSKNLAEAKSSPKAMLFQYEENILLRQRQLDAIKSLLSEQETVEKIIPGGGKSTVISPLTAEMLTNGLNLVIFEVPRALLPSNHRDLNKLSQERFGKKAHRFEFDRTSNCSSQRLEEIYRQFSDIIVNREYLVTIGEAMQSLELKYLELLLTRPEKTKDLAEWRKQVYWASKITHLLKHRGDAIIDEGHKALLLKKKLNYTLGEPRPLSPEFIQHAVEFYKFADLLVGIQYPNSTDSPKKCLENQWPGCLDKLVNNLLTHPSSPLLKYVSQLQKQYGSEAVAQLTAYLNNQEEPKMLTLAEQGLKDAFAFYKEQINLLPKTLKRRYKEHYGPSKLQHKSAINRALAIPYFANDKPNELSRFGNAFETTSYTIQSLLINGLDADLLTEIITQWQNEARIELQTQYTRYKTIDDTPTAKGVALYLKGTGFTLNTITPDNQEHIKTLLKSLKHNKALLFTLLQEKILPQITTEPAILHSDAYNHVDLYRSVKLLSGTPDNHSTFHQRLQYNFKASLGTDGFIDELLKKHNTPIHAIDFTNLGSFLEQVYLKVKNPKTLRAFIDVSATITGVSNFQVAQALATLFASKNASIKYILYFNEDDVLCALDALHNNAPIILGTTDHDDINKLLNCTPNERVTYYDQDHTEGTDIKQDEDSSAVCMIKADTQGKSFRQGCKRMRDIEKNQRIEIIVPESMSGVSLDDLRANMKEKDRRQLKEDNFVAAIAKLTNVIRNDFMQRLDSLDDEDVDTKHQWAIKFQPFFVDYQDTKIWEQYGAIYRCESTEEIFKKYLKNVIESWKYCLTIIQQPIYPKDKQLLKEEMQAIIKIALPLCNKTTITKGPNEKKGLEVETQKEKELLKEIEKVREDMRYDPALEEAHYKNWGTVTLSNFSKKQAEQGSFITPLNQLCNKQEDLQLFSSDLMVSDNYSLEYNNQTSLLGPYLKPVHAIMYRVIDNKISACLISNQELEELTLLLKNNPSISNIWISTTQESVLAGKRPQHILNDAEYLQLLEQVRFFGGKCKELQEQKTPFLWLSKNTNEKLAFFETNIFHYRETQPYELHNLRSALSKKNVGFDYLGNNPFADYTHFKWKTIIPDALKSDIFLLKKLSRAFAEINSDFMNKELTIEQLQNTYLFPPDALNCLQNHLEILNQLKRLLNQLYSKKITIDNLTSDQKTLLEHILHFDLDGLLKKYDIDPMQENAEESYRLNYTLDVLQKIIELPILKNKKPLYGLIINSFQQQDETSLIRFIHHERTREEHLQMILQHTTPSSELLCQIVVKAQNIETLFQALSQENLDEQVWSILFQRPDMTVEIIGQIIEDTAHQKTLQEIINVLDAQNNLFNEIMLQRLINSHILPKDHLVSKCVSPSALRLLLKSNFSFTAKHFMSLSNLFNDEENRELIFQKAFNEDLFQMQPEPDRRILLNFIAKNTNNSKLLQEIINRSLAKNSPLDKEITSNLLDNPALPLTYFVKKCQSQSLIAALLSSNQKLNNSHIIQLSLKAESTDNLQLILQKAADQNLLNSVMNHSFIDKLIGSEQLPLYCLLPYCQSEEFVEALLKSNRVFTLEQLISINRKTKKLGNFELIVDKAFHTNMLPNFLNHMDDNKAFIIALSETTKNKEFLKFFITAFLIKNNLLNQDFLKKIVLNPHAPIDYLVSRCDNEQLIPQLLHSTTPLKSEHLISLSEKTSSPSTLKKILEHKECTSSVYLNVLKNQSFTNSPDKLYDIVISKNERYFDFPLAKELLQKSKNPFADHTTKNHELKPLENALEELRKKSLFFIEKAEKGKKEKYIKASKASFALYVLLHNQSTGYLEGKITATSFTNQALKSIEVYKPELSKHRGGKQILFDFANGLLFIPGLIKYAITGKFRIFKADTKSEKIMGDIKANAPKVS